MRYLVARRGTRLVVVFLGVYILAYVAYIQESEEYSKRVFGYYASMLHASTATPPLP